MTMVVGVCEGRFEFRFEDEGRNQTFEPTRQGLREMALALQALGSPESVMCSSSVDFPQEDGMPQGFDAGAFVGVAVALAMENLVEQMGATDIAPVVAKVVLEH